MAQKRRLSAILFTDMVGYTDLMSRDEQHAWWMASNYALIGEKELAMDWLQISINLGNFNYPFLNEYDPFLENLRGEERFRKMMTEVKARWEAFEG